ncbi:hypothetical protein E2562_029758 [Oryza meyeriana var. granulata]|uniref:Uncharacterized protein n=1 Tax=Oryza meyeriana var. granulata TaxID=110450 RepID=A0A6G1CIC6_9ORYZ|nr:hypothetical protein E2562_029758 [Oryza meyeriana var. granulata]
MYQRKGNQENRDSMNIHIKRESIFLFGSGGIAAKQLHEPSFKKFALDKINSELSSELDELLSMDEWDQKDGVSWLQDGRDGITA